MRKTLKQQRGQNKKDENDKVKGDDGTDNNNNC